MKSSRIEMNIGELKIIGTYEPATDASGPRGEPPDTDAEVGN